MPIDLSVAPSSPNSCNTIAAEMSVDDPEVIILQNFKLKPIGTGAARHTLVENDSLSSYSLPEETSRRNGATENSGKLSFKRILHDEFTFYKLHAYLYSNYKLCEN